MPRVAKELTDLAVRRLKHPTGRGVPRFVAVGGVPGLHIQITHTGAKSWVLRFTVRGKVRSMGLGSYSVVGLAAARELAREARYKLTVEGIDPIKERAEARAVRMTFTKAIDGWDKENPHKFGSDKHREVWLASVRGIDGMQEMAVDEITQEDVWRYLEPIANRTPDTARRLRSRIAEVLDWAEDEKQRSGPNPAATGWLKRKLAAKTAGAKVTHRPALQVEDAPRWWAALRKLDGIGSRALEFIALTAARSGEVRGATWDEIDKGVWTIPAARMKMRRDHTVPLSTAAQELLKALPRDNKLIFPSAQGKQMSDVTPLATMKRLHEADIKRGGPGFLDRESGRPAVPHGLRSTFRVWAGQQGYSREHAELALAHQFGDAVEQAYQRDIYTEQRRPMMQAWSEHLG